MDQNLVQSKQRGPLGKDIWQILKRLARGENIVIYLSTDMRPRQQKNGGERERGKPVHFFFFTVRAAAIFASPPLHDPGTELWQYPPFRVADTPLRGVSWVLPALRSEGDHGARAPAQHFMV